LLRSDQSPDAPGYFDVEIEDFASSEQYYLENTPILETVLRDTHGNAVAITDFAPRYAHLGRMFNPVMLLRGLRPVSGQPRIRVPTPPATYYGSIACKSANSSNHIRYRAPDFALTLTTNASLTYVIEERFLALDRDLHPILVPDESIPESVVESYRSPLN